MVRKNEGQEPLAITAATQKAGLRSPQTHLWLIKHWLSVSILDLRDDENRPLAKPKNVVIYFT